jgi:hypothetical protein
MASAAKSRRQYAVYRIWRGYAEVAAGGAAGSISVIWFSLC